MRRIILIIHNLRSMHNVGSLLRSSDAFGVEKIIVTGYTPYPAIVNDSRLPHIQLNQTTQIAKTALGAEKTMNIEYCEDIERVIHDAKNNGYMIVGLEQDGRSESLRKFHSTENIALIIGEEVCGIASHIRNLCEILVEIPMLGSKESLNVAVATGIALYQLRHTQ